MTESNERPAATMKLVGRRLCLDFANTVGGRTYGRGGRKGEAICAVLKDKLVNYAALLAWGRHAGILSETQERHLLRRAGSRNAEAMAVLRRAKELREAVYRLCGVVIHKTAPRAADISLLNAELTHAQNHERLVVAGGRFTWQWVESKEAFDYVLWPVVRSAAELLTAGDLTRLHECRGEDCGWLFEDISRNRRRQWCDMKDCGNRVKVRRFRERQRRLSGKRIQRSRQR